MTENSSLNSPAPGNNIAYFSDGNVLRDLGKIEGRLDGHDREINECKANIKDIRDSVSKLKEWRASIKGVVTTIAIIVSVVTTLVASMAPRIVSWFK